MNYDWDRLGQRLGWIVIGATVGYIGAHILAYILWGT